MFALFASVTCGTGPRYLPSETSNLQLLYYGYPPSFVLTLPICSLRFEPPYARILDMKIVHWQYQDSIRLCCGAAYSGWDGELVAKPARQR